MGREPHGLLVPGKGLAAWPPASETALTSAPDRSDQENDMRGASPPHAGAECPAPGAPEQPKVRIGTTRERVWAAIQELAAIGKHFTRQKLKKLTELPFHIVDDHVDKLIEEGHVQRIGSGIFEMVVQWRHEIPISTTPLDDGSVMLERADMVWHLTPTEARRLAKQLAGWAHEQAQLDGQDLLMATLAAVDVRTRKLLVAQNAQQRPKPAEPRPRPSRRRSAATA